MPRSRGPQSAAHAAALPASGDTAGAGTAAAWPAEADARPAAAGRNRRARVPRWTAPFDDAGIAAARLDGSGRITDCNRVLARWLRHPRRTLVGRALADFLPEGDELGARRLAQLLAGRRPARTRIEQRFVRRDGRVVWGRVQVSRTGDAPGGEPVTLAVIADITDQRVTREQLEESQRTLATLIGNLPGMAYRCRNDRHWTMEFVNDGCRALTGYRPRDLLHNRAVAYADLIHPDDRDYVFTEVQRALDDRRPFRLTYRIVTAAGETRWVWEQGLGVCSADGGIQGIEGFITDVSDRRQAEEALRESEARYRALAENAFDLIAEVDEEGRCLYASPSNRDVLGYEPHEVVGKSVWDVIHPDDLQAARAMRQGGLADGRPRKMTFRARTGKGGWLWLEMTAKPFTAADGAVHAVVVARDVTERKGHEERLAFLATHDPLTELPNRHALEEALVRAVERARNGVPSTLLFLDLDNFKLVNDTLGHTAGDQVLGTLARLLRRCLRPADLLARFGGDEFAVLLEDTGVKEAWAVADRLRLAVEESPFTLVEDTGEHPFSLGLSIGLVPIDGRTEPGGLLSHADSAMYAAKDQGGDRVVLYRHEDDVAERLSEANRWATRIRDALAEGRFELHYQPVVQLSDGAVQHYEALVRMRDEDGNLVMPGMFIPAAEQFGLMSRLDRWVVEHVIATLKEHPDLHVFVNLSGRSLSDQRLLEGIESSLRDSGIAPGQLGFEITETALINDLTLAERWVTRLKALGCRFALDDFGAGFSSLAYLRTLPLDLLKIDGAFIRPLAANHRQRELVEAIHGLARALRMDSVAEFVENEEILRVLKDIGITAGQGYHLGRPAPGTPAPSA